MKTTISLSVNTDIYEAAKAQYKGQISSMFEEFLVELLTMKSDLQTVNKKRELKEALIKGEKIINDQIVKNKVIKYELSNIYNEENQNKNEEVELAEIKYFNLTQKEKDDIIDQWQKARESGEIDENMFVKTYYAKFIANKESESSEEK